MSTQLLDLPLELLVMIPAYLRSTRDRPSLKALSLTSSVFREPCQRFLLNAIAPILRAPYHSPNAKHTCAALLARLTQNPHLEKYITIVTLDLRYNMDGDDAFGPVVHALFRRLTRVRKITLESARTRWADWNDVFPPIRTAVLELAARLSPHGGSGSLRSIFVASVRNIPQGDMQRLFAAAPTLIFFQTSVVTDTELDTTIPPLRKSIRHLVIRASRSVTAMLLQPPLKFYTEDLRRVNVGCDEDPAAMGLYAARAETIEHIQLFSQCRYSNGVKLRFSLSSDPLPDDAPSQSLREAGFPRLRHLEIFLAVGELKQHTGMTPVWLQFVTIFLRGSALASLTLETTQDIIPANGEDLMQAYARVSHQTLSRLDELIAGHPALARVYFCTQFVASSREDLRAKSVAFSAAVRKVMVNAQRKGIVCFQ